MIFSEEDIKSLFLVLFVCLFVCSILQYLGLWLGGRVGGFAPVVLGPGVVVVQGSYLISNYFN